MSFIENLFLFAASFLIGLSGAMMPGPVTTQTINETLKYMRHGPGWLVGVMISSGHAVLEIALMLALWLGASYLFTLPPVLILIGVLGGSSLVVFGVIGLRSYRRNEQALVALFESLHDPGTGAPVTGPSPGSILRRAFAFGFVLSATSSGWWAWWASIGMNAIKISNVAVFSSFPVFVSFYIGHIFADFAWFTFISGAVSLGKNKLNYQAYRALLIGTNVFLIIMGAFFIITAI